ncbi:hypothetical protein Tco_0158429 [Tanacetum coccineum]
MEHKVEEVQYHLYRHGIDISYTKWTKHGEEDEPSISAPKPVNATTKFVDDMDFAYIPTDGPATVEMVNATKDNFDVDDLVKFQELLLDAGSLFYKGMCLTSSRLSAIVKLLNLKEKMLLRVSRNSATCFPRKSKDGFDCSIVLITDEIVPYIERHKQVLKTENPGKRIAFLENEHSKSFAKWLREENSGVSVEAIDRHISKEVTTTRKAYYYGVLQEIWYWITVSVKFLF